MSKSKNRIYWLVWIISTVAISAYLAYSLLLGENKETFMPGKLTDGHHLLKESCESCHTSEFTSEDDFQKACESCHGDIRKKPFDSHPKGKFRDPRNADLLAKINALRCITCHTEHQPEMLQTEGYTQPKDYCIHCHKDVAEKRPTHKNMDFMTCNNSGCHNFHNNRSLYTEFLLKHQGEPEHLEKAIVPLRDFVERLEELPDYPHKAHPVKPLTLSDTEIPVPDKANEKLHREWLESSHAQAGVDCNACHMQTQEDESKQWIEKPDHTSCKTCHNTEVEHFQQGKHGMRLVAGLSPLKPKMARLPMKEDSLETEMSCTSCHTSHSFDTREAAVESCLQCHNDEHSLNYKDSPHYALWQKELSGELPEGSGVSCATCHMPRAEMDVSEWAQRVVVQHNQSASLYTREKMIRPTCINCHGLEFSINALADNDLITSNYKGMPAYRTKSFELLKEAERLHKEKKKKEAEQKESTSTE